MESAHLILFAFAYQYNVSSPLFLCFLWSSVCIWAGGAIYSQDQVPDLLKSLASSQEDFSFRGFLFVCWCFLVVFWGIFVGFFLFGLDFVVCGGFF